MAINYIDTLLLNIKTQDFHQIWPSNKKIIKIRLEASGFKIYNTPPPIWNEGVNIYAYG